MEKKNIHSFRNVKEKELTKFDAVDDRFVPGLSSGFQTRDLLRFFLVDIIIILSVRLLYYNNLLPSLEHYVVLNLIGKTLLGVYLVWLVGSRPDGWQAAGAGSAGRWWAWPVSLALFAAAVPLFVHLSIYNMDVVARAFAVFGIAYEPSPQNVTLIIFEEGLATWIRGLLLLFAVLVGPAMEELAFRGVGLDGYGKNWGLAWSIAWTSLLFGLYHFDPARILSLAAIGAMLAVGRVLAKSLWCSIAIHTCYNAGVLLWMWNELAGEG